MKIFVSSLIVVLLSFSCKKNIDYTIKGQITDSSLGGNLSGATVELYSYSKGSVTGELMQTTQTDSQGNYSFTFDRDRYDKLEVKIVKANYFTDSKTVLFSELSNKEDYIIDLN
ncbi:MAG: carboxypeptidase-like regulatory domain-containing protein, partial [Fluviicola sp.]